MKYKSIHLVGANGVGLSAIGKLMIQKGVKVSGSDMTGGIFSDELKEIGAKIFNVHDAKNLGDDLDLVIYSSAVPKDNPELLEAKRRNIKTMTYAEILGEVSRSYKTIAVAGTHGKSTTTAMLAVILEEAGLDPTVIVGSRVPVWKYGNIRLGKSEIFVVEACEYRAHFLELDPEMVVLTNIDTDHLDYYRDLEHILETFQKFVNKAQLVLVNKDNKESNNLNILNKVEYSLKDYDIKLSIPGDYNAENASAALTAAIKFNVDEDKAKESLKNFKGIWRRFEDLGLWKGARIISDYGHHPTAIRRFLEAAKEKYRDERLIHIFQPHQHSRTRDLFNNFVDSLGQVDITIIPEIYAVTGRMKEEDISSFDLVDAIKRKKPDVEIFYAKDLDKTKEMILNIVKPNDVLLFQGAGDIDDLARALAKEE